MGRARTTITAVSLVVRRFGREVFADQVREGRLRTAGMPSTVRRMARLGMGLFWVVAGLALIAPVLGLGRDKELASGFVDLLLVVCLGFLNICVQPMRRGWRVGALVLSATSMIPQMILLGIMVGTGGTSFITVLGLVGLAVLGGSLMLLIVFIIMDRGLRGWRLWLAGAAGGVGHLTALVIAWGFPFARSVNELSVMITDVALLYVAIPLAAAAGVSYAQVATNVATWAVLSVRDLLTPAAWVASAVVVCGAGLAMPLLRGPALPGAVVTVVHTLVSVALSAAGMRAVHRPVDVPRPTAVTADLASKGLLFAGLLCSWLLLLPVVALPGELLKGVPLSVFGDGVTAVVTIVLWARGIRRRQSIIVVMAPGIFCTCVYSMVLAIARRTGLGALPALSARVTGAVLVVLALCQALAWARRGGFSPDRDRGRWAILTMIGLEAVIFPWRESLAEPLEAAVQGSAAAVMLAGLVWRVLTEAEYTHGSSPGFPAPARVLFFVGQALLAAVFVLQSVMLPHAMSGVINLQQWTSVVDSVVGHGVQIGVAVGLLMLGRWRVDPMDPADAVEEMRIEARRLSRRGPAAP